MAGRWVVSLHDANIVTCGDRNAFVDGICQVQQSSKWYRDRHESLALAEGGLL